MTLGSEWTLKRPINSFLRQLQARVSVSQEFNQIKEQKTISIDRPMGIPSSMEEGEADGLYLPYNYIADMLIDGKPFYANAKLNGDFAFNWLKSSHTLKLGAEWKLSKTSVTARYMILPAPYRPPLLPARETTVTSLPDRNYLSMQKNK